MKLFLHIIKFLVVILILIILILIILILYIGLNIYVKSKEEKVNQQDFTLEMENMVLN